VGQEGRAQKRRWRVEGFVWTICAQNDVKVHYAPSLKLGHLEITESQVVIELFETDVE
jgi:hypothetical protein